MSRSFSVTPVESTVSLPAMDDASFPKVTVNILSYNRIKELRINLNKITTELDYPQDKLEIIVVDNASTDGSPAMVRSEFPQVQLVETSQNEGVTAWNEGFKRGAGEYFLVLDDDCYMEGDALKKAVTSAVKHAADIVSFRVVNPCEEGFVFNKLVNPGLLSFWGCAALIRRKCVETLGGYDSYFLWQELEFTIRAFDAGFSHLYLPQVAAFHMKPAGSMLKTSDFSRRIYFINHGYLITKLFAAVLVPRLVLFAVAGSIKGGWRHPAAAVRWWFAFAGGLWRGLQKRKPVEYATSRLFADNYPMFAPFSLAWGRRRVDSTRRFYEERAHLFSLDQAAILRSSPAAK